MRNSDKKLKKGIYEMQQIKRSWYNLKNMDWMKEELEEILKEIMDLNDYVQFSCKKHADSIYSLEVSLKSHIKTKKSLKILTFWEDEIVCRN